MPVKIIIASSFDRDYQKLPQELQRVADKQIELLSADLAHPSLRSFLFSFHKHPTILFLRSLVNPRRISLYQTKKRLRAIVHFVFATKCAKPPSTPSYPLHFAHTGYKFRPVNAPRITRHPVGCQNSPAFLFRHYKTATKLSTPASLFIAPCSMFSAPCLVRGVMSRFHRGVKPVDISLLSASHNLPFELYSTSERVDFIPTLPRGSRRKAPQRSS